MDLSTHELPETLFFFLTDLFGDDEQLALEDVFELHDRGIKWRAVCIKNSGIHHRLAQFGTDRVRPIEHPPSKVLDREFRDFLRTEINSGAGLLHVYDTNHLGSILPWILKYNRLPVVVSEGPNVRKSIRHFFQSFFYPRIDALLVPSATLKRRISMMRPKLAAKLRILHPGLDFNIFNPDHFDFTVLRKKWGIDPDMYVVGMIASQEYPKAQATFIKGAASFLRNEELAKRTKFVIVGFEQGESQILNDLIKQFHLQDQIILADKEESIPKVLGSLDVYVLPSSKAMFGLQAIEALAMGTPIICAAGPDSSEWTGNSECGLLIRSGDSFDLQRKLRMILEDPEELKSMGKRSVQFARDNYDRKQRTDKLIEIYQKVVRRRSH